jgi:hypothetical protein
LLYLALAGPLAALALMLLMQRIESWLQARRLRRRVDPDARS